MKISAQNVALMAVFAALSVVAIKIFPGIPIVGVGGASIKFDAVLAPVYGLIVGPYLGFLAALIGGLVTASTPFDVLTSFSPAVSALVAGLLTQRNIGNRDSRVKGWMMAALVLGILVLGWYLTGVGQGAPFYPILHVAGLILILAMRGRIAEVFREEKLKAKEWHVRSAFLLAGIVILVAAYMFTRPLLSDVPILPLLALPFFLSGAAIVVYSLFGMGKTSFVWTVSLASYCGIIADHMLGNLVFIASVNILIPINAIEDLFLKPLGLPNMSALFMYMLPVSAVERILFTVVAAILGVGLILALKRANLSTRRNTDHNAQAA